MEIEENLKETYDANEWLVLYNAYVTELKQDSKNVEKKANLPRMRLIIQGGTIKHIKDGFYNFKEQTIKFDHEKLKHSVEKSVQYDGSEFETCQLIKKFEKMSIQVIQGDCLEIALEIQEKYNCVPVVLNMANAFTPGGGYKHGSGAQEENLFRRSNLAFCLDENPKVKWSYPIPEYGSIYTPEAVVFRGAEAKGYPFLPEPKCISFIASAAYRHPLLIDGELEESYAFGTEKKIRTILNVAYANNHSIVILSAFGCGAFKNPPLHMASIFKKVLKEFDGCFEHVIFAIFDDHNAGQDGNVAPFKKIFEE